MHLLAITSEVLDDAAREAPVSVQPAVLVEVDAKEAYASLCVFLPDPRYGDSRLFARRQRIALPAPACGSTPTAGFEREGEPVSDKASVGVEVIELLRYSRLIRRQRLPQGMLELVRRGGHAEAVLPDSGGAKLLAKPSHNNTCACQAPLSRSINGSEWLPPRVLYHLR